MDSLSSAPPKLHDNRKSPLDNNGRQTPITAPVAYIPQEDGDLVIALYNFKGTKSDELDFHKGEYLRVTNWNFESDWVFGYKSGNKNKKGSFPKTYISICNDKKGIFFIYLFIYLFIRSIFIIIVSFVENEY